MLLPISGSGSGKDDREGRAEEGGEAGATAARAKKAG